MLKNLSKFIGILTFLTVASILFGSHKAEAATINVVAGTDAINNNGQCQLSEAIQNINDHAITNDDCIAGDGNNDTINLPSGTFTLSADLPNITQSVKIIGQGMTNTIIDGDNGQYHVFFFTGGTVDATVSDLKITGFLGVSIWSQNRSMDFSRLDIDGTNVIADPLLGGVVAGIYLEGDVYNAEDISIHDLNMDANLGVFGFIASANSKTMTVNIEKVTIARLINTSPSGGQVNGFSMTVGLFDSPPTTGTLNANIANVTVDYLQNDGGIAIGFGAIAFAEGGEANVNLDVTNVTLTRVQGLSMFGGNLPSMSLYTGAGAVGNNDVANTNINAHNVLVANNTSDGNPSNCNTLDFNPLLNGTGTSNPTITSLGHNLSDDNTCISFNQPGDQENLTNLGNTLGPLQLNGGLTPTRALLPGSPAIGAGSSVLGISTDQRGIARPSAPDVGAYQTVQGTSTSSPNNGFAGVAVPNSGYGIKRDNFSYSFLFILLGISSALFIKKKNQFRLKNRL